MSDAPQEQPEPEHAQGNTAQDAGQIAGQPPGAIPQQPPSGNKDKKTGEKRRYTSDPGMFWVQVVGVIVVAVYASITFVQWRTLEQQVKDQKEALDIDTRATLGSKEWDVKINNNVPVISFKLRNTGKSPAHILKATYEYALGGDDITKIIFGQRKQFIGQPAMIDADTLSAPLVVADLPALAPDTKAALSTGGQWIYLRSIIIYQSILAQLYQGRFTAKYGRIAGPDGKAVLGFQFPEADFPPDQWAAWADNAQFRRENMRRYRCFNYVEKYADYADYPKCDEH
jgi:hypothetical protein